MNQMTNAAGSRVSRTSKTMSEVWRSRPPAMGVTTSSILRRYFEAIDDEHLDWRTTQNELQSKLILDGREERRQLRQSRSGDARSCLRRARPEVEAKRPVRTGVLTDGR